MYIRNLHFISGEQHSSWLLEVTAISVHRPARPQPPLSISHEYSQYGRPVVSHTLHCDPVGHWEFKQPAVTNQIINRLYTACLYYDY